MPSTFQPGSATILNQIPMRPSRLELPQPSTRAIAQLQHRSCRKARHQPRSQPNSRAGHQHWPCINARLDQQLGSMAHHPHGPQLRARLLQRTGSLAHNQHGPRLRARLQPCQITDERHAASAAEVRFSPSLTAFQTNPAKKTNRPHRRRNTHSGGPSSSSAS